MTAGSTSGGVPDRWLLLAQAQAAQVTGSGWALPVSPRAPSSGKSPQVDEISPAELCRIQQRGDLTPQRADAGFCKQTDRPELQPPAVSAPTSPEFKLVKSGKEGNVWNLLWQI